MPTTTESSKWILALAALGSSPLWAFDPLMDEPEPFAAWKVSQDVSYAASTTPTWETGTWFEASKDYAFETGSLNLSPSMGILTDDFQLDSAWNLEPKASAKWSRENLSAEVWGWGLWNDLGWTDEGAGSELSWLLTKSEKQGARWKTGVHGWLSEHSGSAVGLSLSRNAKGEVWSSEVSTIVRRLWDVDASQERPGSARMSVSTSNLTDQWQFLFRTSLDRNWNDLSAGLGVDLDLRATDGESSASQSAMGKGRMSSSASGTTYATTLDPYASLSWSPGSWSLDVTSGWSIDVQRTKGAVEPVSTYWMSVEASKSW